MANGKDKLTLASILKDSNYKLSLFPEKDIKVIESKIKIQKNKSLTKKETVNLKLAQTMG
jgi:hypothetical protein